MRFEKQLRRCRRAVSEIIGNLLILAITVTLFSSVMFYVMNMPSPDEDTYADMNYAISDFLSDNSRWVNITHKGGQTLYNSTTDIYIYEYNFTSSSYNAYCVYIGNSTPSIGEEWTPGETWRFKMTGIEEGTPISIMIVDTSTGDSIWDADLIGGEVTSTYAPIIGVRGTTPSTIIDGSSFIIYATVSDPNNDLNKNSVYVNATSIGLGWVQLTDNDNNGVYTSGSLAGKLAMDGKVVLINATDDEGKTTKAQMTLSAEQASTGGGNTTQYFGPFNEYPGYFVNGTYPPNASGGQSDSGGTTFYYIRRQSDNNITREFEPGEAYYIEVYSNKLINLALENSFYIYNPSTGAAISGTDTTNAFSYGGIYSTFYRYYINLTAPTQALKFPIEIALRDNTGTVIEIYDSIIVSGASYPILKTYKLNSTSGLLEECNTFNHTDTVYLKIITKDVDSTITAVTMNSLQINAYTGKYIVKQIPPTATTWYSGAEPALAENSPLTQIYKTAKSTLAAGRVVDSNLNSVYTIQIDLLNANQGWWLSGTNSYTLLIPVFTDSGSYGVGETYYKMSYQFNVTAPKDTTDLVASVGSGSLTWSASGAVWDDNALYWYENGETFSQWDATEIDADTYDGPIGMEMVDVDNDGYLDVVVGFQDSSISIAWYRNEKSDGSKWSTFPYTICTAFDALSGLQRATNNPSYTYKDTTNEDMSVWATSYSTDHFSSDYYSQNEIVGAIKAGDFDGDGDMDIVASFVHAVVYTTASGSGDADYSNSFGMYFNRGIYVFWNDGSWTRTQLEGTAVYTNQDTNPAAMDLAVDDLNQDGVDDIVAVYETGVTSIWLNKYLTVIGTSSTPQLDSFGTGSKVAAANVPTVSGTTPWSHTSTGACSVAPSVDIADVDLNGYPDIIRTSTVTSSSSSTVTVIRTMTTAATTSIQTPNAEYTNGTSASVSGTYANLANDNDVYETLTEVYLETVNVTSVPSAIYNDVLSTYDDTTTGQTLSSLAISDSNTYVVGATEKMSIFSFGLNSAYSSYPITQVQLTVNYLVDSGYLGTNYIQYSMDGVTWYNTTVKPSSSEANVTKTIDLRSLGVDTWSELQSLRVFFNNNGTAGAVRFDYVNLIMKFAESRWLEYHYEIPNISTMITHQLSMVAMTATTGETFDVYYSTDNNIWYPAFSYMNTTEETKVILLPHTTNDVYYLKIMTTDSTSSDTTNNTLLIDQLIVTHTSPNVYWPSGSTMSISFSMGSNNEWISALAVGDVTAAGSSKYPDGYPDIIVGTTAVGTGARTLMIAPSTGSGTFSTSNLVDTSELAANVGGSNALYNSYGIALGDFNGDGYTDIALIIGYAPGRSGGSAASIWLYRNDPSVGQWDEQVLNILASGESAINLVAGSVDINILYPVLGVMGMVAAGGVINKVERRRKK